MTQAAVAETEFTRIEVLVSATGKRHRTQQYSWGTGTRCSDRFVMGEITEGLVGDIDCEHCLAWSTPTTWQVGVPDKRFTTGIRLVHTDIPTEEEADRLAEALGLDGTYVQETPRDLPYE